MKSLSIHTTRYYLISILALFLLMAALLPPRIASAAGTVIPKNIKFVPVVGGLSDPLFVTHAGDGSNRLFIVERSGKICIYKNSALNAKPFLDLSAMINITGGEQGLLGLAFAPDYSTSGRFYVVYTMESSNTIALARYLVSSDPDRAITASGHVLFTIPKDHTNHNGGMLAFGPDGYLYMSVGDGGGAGDPQGNGQKKNTLLGKILRLDVSGSEFTIPPTNPFIGVAQARSEIWAYGLRNPWRFSFDRSTGDLYIGDVGQNTQEEIDFQPSASTGGENYGWNLLEGNLCYLTSPCPPPSDYAPPVAVYTHGTNDSIGCSVTGGYVYRGSAFPALSGVYLYADFCRGKLWGMAKDGSNKWYTVLIRDTDYSISSFGEDEVGELYITDFAGGQVLRLAQGPVVSTILSSQAARDGLIVESSETSSKGGFISPAASIIRLGDQAQNRQVLGIVSFNTSSLPDNAVILSARLTFRKSRLVGSDPLVSLAPLQADIRTGYFGTSPALEPGDFQAAASRQYTAGAITPLANNFYALPLGAGIPYINKAGLTQLRLYFVVQDNNNFSADLLNIYSGENTTLADRPRLTIRYYIP